MAPEQLRGSASTASDLYGLGATLVYLLYRTTPAALPQKRLRVELPKTPAISSELAAFVRRLLEPAPEDRFRSASDALAALSGRGRGLRVALLSGLLAVVVAGSATVVWKTRDPRAVNGVGPNIVELPPRLELFRFPELRDLRRVPAHVSAVFDVTALTDGKMVATASNDATAKVWSTETWKSMMSVGHNGRVSGVRFVDANVLATVGDHTLRTWDIPFGTARLRVDVGTQQVTALDIDASRENAAVASFDGNVRVISLSNGAVRAILPHSPGKGRVFTVRYSPDGSRIATGGEDRVARIWNADDGKLVAQTPPHGAPVTSVAYSGDGTQIATTSDDHSVRVMYAADLKVLATLLDSMEETWCASFSDDGNYLTTGAKDGALRLYGLPTVALRTSEQAGGGGILAMAFSPHLGLLTAHGDGTIHVRALPGGQTHTLPAVHAPFVPPEPNGPKELVLAREGQRIIDRWTGGPALLDAAEKKLDEALLLHPKFAPALAQLARIEMRRGSKSGTYVPARIDAARNLLLEAIKSDPKHVESRTLLVWAYLRGHRYDAARRALDEAETVAPNAPECLVLHGELASALEAWEEAEKYLVRALDSKEATAAQIGGAEETLQKTYEHLGDFDAVDALHRRAIAREPRNPRLLLNYAGFLNSRGDYLRAEEVARASLDLSDSPAAHVNHASANVGLGIFQLWDRRDVDRAAAFFEAAVKEHPASALGHCGLAAVHRARAARARDRKELERAKRELEIAAKLDPEIAWVGLAREDVGQLEKQL